MFSLDRFELTNQISKRCEWLIMAMSDTKSAFSTINFSSRLIGLIPPTFCCLAHRIASFYSLKKQDRHFCCWRNVLRRRRWMNFDVNFEWKWHFSVLLSKLFGFGKESVDLDFHHRHWYTKVIFLSFSIKFSLKREKWKRKIMKQEQVSMCFWILLSLCVIESCYGKFLVQFKWASRLLRERCCSSTVLYGWFSYYVCYWNASKRK